MPQKKAVKKPATKLAKPAKAVAPTKPVKVAKVEKAEKPLKAVKANLSPDELKLATKWNQLFEKSKTLDAIPYKMSGSYEPKTPIKHKVLGWGYVLNSSINRIEVLFEEGVKTLVANYKD